MSHNVIAHTNVKVSHQAKKAMGDLPRRDHRLLSHLLKRLQRNSIFKVFQIPAKSETKSAFVKGQAWLHTLHSAVAIFRLKEAAIELVDVLVNLAEYKVVWLELVVIREMEKYHQRLRALTMKIVPNDRYRYTSVFRTRT